MALPAPQYPQQPAAGAELGDITWRMPWGSVVVRLHQPPNGPRGRRPRCDSMEARDEYGQSLATGGWHAIHRAVVSKLLPRALPRAALRGLLIGDLDDAPPQT